MNVRGRIRRRRFENRVCRIFVVPPWVAFNRRKPLPFSPRRLVWKLRDRRVMRSQA